MDEISSLRIQLNVSDQSRLGHLQAYLSWAAPDASALRVAGRPRAGEQGALDTLMIAADSSVLVAVVNVLPQFLKSRKRAVSVTLKATVKGRQREMTVTAANVEEVLPVIDRFLRG